MGLLASARKKAAPVCTRTARPAQTLAGYFNMAKQSTFFLEDGRLRVLLTEAQKTVQRGLREAYLARLAERRELLGRAALNASWHFGTHDTVAAPAQALLWLWSVLEG